MKYLIKMKDGSIGIMTTVDNEDPNVCLSKWHESNLEKVMAYEPIEESAIPKDREFRNAWCHIENSNGINIDLSKAKNIQLEKMRTIRNKKLLESDGEMMRLYDIGDENLINEFKKYRQTLRDSTEPLKNIQVSGYNNTEALETIKRLGTLGV